MLQGHEVIVADNFFTGRKRNIEHWIGHENFELINHDIVNPLYIEGNDQLDLLSSSIESFLSGWNLSFGFSGLSTALHVQSREDHQGELDGHDQYAR